MMTAMTKLAERIKELSDEGARGPHLTRILRGLGQGEREDLLGLLSDPDISSVAISKALKEFGWSISESSVRRYRSAM